jgi:hypothetical protein
MAFHCLFHELALLVTLPQCRDLKCTSFIGLHDLNNLIRQGDGEGDNNKDDTPGSLIAISSFVVAWFYALSCQPVDNEVLVTLFCLVFDAPASF